MQKIKSMPRAERVALSIAAGVAAAGTVYCLYKYSHSLMAKPIEDAGIDMRRQAVDVPGSSAKRSVFSEELLDSYDGVTTPYEGYLRGQRLSGDGPCLGTQVNDSYSWITYSQVLERGIQFGSGLMSLGYESSQETFVGIYAANKLEWILTDLACITYSMVSVPLYDSLGPEVCTYIINHADIALIICDADKVNLLLEKAEKCPKLKHIVKIGDVLEEEKTKAEKSGISVLSFTEVEELGKKSPREKKPSKPDDLYTICFTSGTTSFPKGVMITCRNIIANVSAFLIHFERNEYAIVPSDVSISYLPLPHMYERTIQLVLRTAGGSAGFYRGDVKLLLEDIQRLRPTFFPSVPRLLNRLYDKVISGVESSNALKKWLFNRAFSAKKASFGGRKISKDSFWDKLVFRKIQAILGGNVRMIGTGAAPIEAKVLAFLRVVFGCAVMEGYGQTECSTAASLTNVMDDTSGHVGPPCVCNMMKLVDVPDMDYYTSNNQGEVCIFGPNVFKGYLKAPDQTAETIDEDGWLHTGDIGEWTKDSTLKIIGRKKCIFKLSQGEYIAPEKIENVYIKSPFVAQAFVHGHSIKSCVVGVIMPDAEVLMKWAKEKNIGGPFSELCQMQNVKDMIFKDIITRGKEAKLASFEQVKSIYLHSELFSVENNLLTPTFKSKRFVIQKRFASEIDSMYEKLEEIEHPKVQS